MRKMISLCCGKKECPVVEITDDYVKIGERGNFCSLRRSEWEALKKKIIDREI